MGRAHATAGLAGADNHPVNIQDPQFHTGDVVRLKAGGPPMVIRAVSGDTAYCQWYAGLELHQGTFLFSSLCDISHEKREPLPGQPAQPKEAPLRAS